jgi:hypothetical protein
MYGRADGMPSDSQSMVVCEGFVAIKIYIPIYFAAALSGPIADRLNILAACSVSGTSHRLLRYLLVEKNKVRDDCKSFSPSMCTSNMSPFLFVPGVFLLQVFCNEIKSRIGCYGYVHSTTIKQQRKILAIV